MITLGIDVGGSTTKIIGIEDGKIRSPQCITAADPVTSLFGAFGKYLYDNGISLSDVSRGCRIPQRAGPYGRGEHGHRYIIRHGRR